jgi:hypothetical protein
MTSYNNPSNEKHKIVLNIDGVPLTGRFPPSIYMVSPFLFYMKAAVLEIIK